MQSKQKNLKTFFAQKKTHINLKQQNNTKAIGKQRKNMKNKSFQLLNQTFKTSLKPQLVPCKQKVQNLNTQKKKKKKQKTNQPLHSPKQFNKKKKIKKKKLSHD
ncbi:hypothetical protein HYD97_00250 [Mycoplasmopsis bovis]|nr:hypothetical protein [Mycoplasmopsis bovis]QQH34329.1 hypothetical protein HYD97_00250 [Mycoplasmopsis bovis]